MDQKQRGDQGTLDWRRLFPEACLEGDGVELLLLSRRQNPRQGHLTKKIRHCVLSIDNHFYFTTEQSVIKKTSAKKKAYSSIPLQIEALSSPHRKIFAGCQIKIPK